jgi:hypothetical protein
MTPEQQQEEISKAYLHAVAAQCGFTVASWSQDHGGIDATVGAASTVGAGHVSRPKVDIQLPLLDALRVREATRNMLLAAAHSTLSPQAFFPRMSRSDATQLLATVQEGQTQRGCFVSRFIVPVEPAVAQSALFGEPEEPYGRHVVRLLMHALEHVRQVRARGELDPLISSEKEGVSGNLLAALATVRADCRWRKRSRLRFLVTKSPRPSQRGRCCFLSRGRIAGPRCRCQCDAGARAKQRL